MTDLIERMAHAVNERWFGEIDGARDMVRAALKAAEEAGFVLTPREPDENMENAGWAHTCSEQSCECRPGDIYSIMLAARPSPPGVR